MTKGVRPVFRSGNGVSRLAVTNVAQDLAAGSFYLCADGSIVVQRAGGTYGQRLKTDGFCGSQFGVDCGDHRSCRVWPWERQGEANERRKRNRWRRQDDKGLRERDHTTD